MYSARPIDSAVSAQCQAPLNRNVFAIVGGKARNFAAAFLQQKLEVGRAQRHDDLPAGKPVVRIEPGEIQPRPPRLHRDPSRNLCAREHASRNSPYGLAPPILALDPDCDHMAIPAHSPDRNSDACKAKKLDRVGERREFRRSEKAYQDRTLMAGSNVLLIGRGLDEGKPPKRPESRSWST